jgi:hypothetical protein
MTENHGRSREERQEGRQKGSQEGRGESKPEGREGRESKPEGMSRSKITHIVRSNDVEL